MHNASSTCNPGTKLCCQVDALVNVSYPCSISRASKLIPSRILSKMSLILRFIVRTLQLMDENGRGVHSARVFMDYVLGHQLVY